MRVRFVQDTQNHLTGNTLRKRGETMDLRDDYAAGLVSQGFAVDVHQPALVPSAPASVPVSVFYDWEPAGVSMELSDEMNDMGLTSPAALLAFPDLTSIKGIGKVRARALIEYASNKEIG